MKQAELNHHRSMKKQYPSYPNLPRVFRLKDKKYKALSKDKGYVESVTRGFLGRVFNWERDKAKAAA